MDQKAETKHLSMIVNMEIDKKDLEKIENQRISFAEMQKLKNFWSKKKKELWIWRLFRVSIHFGLLFLVYSGIFHLDLGPTFDQLDSSMWLRWFIGAIIVLSSSYFFMLLEIRVFGRTPSDYKVVEDSLETIRSSVLSDFLEFRKNSYAKAVSLLFFSGKPMEEVFPDVVGGKWIVERNGHSDSLFDTMIRGHKKTAGLLIFSYNWEVPVCIKIEENILLSKITLNPSGYITLFLEVPSIAEPVDLFNKSTIDYLDLSVVSN